MRCADRSGFLFAHTCDREAIASCAGCGKMICQDHLQPGNLCVSCARSSGADQRSDRVHHSPHHADDPYRYAGSYYHGYHHYDDRDHRVFDSQADAGDSGFEGDFEGS